MPARSDGVELSAQTPVLSSVHHPLGNPGGPGLFRVKGLMLPAYIENIARALIRSGHQESQAIQLAIGICRRWAEGGGKVTPEVRAAAAKAMAEWEAAKLRAHSHSVTGLPALELATVAIDPDQPRVEPGKPEGGQYDAKPVILSRYSTPDEIASAVGRMGPQQRAAYRALTMAPPGYVWSDTDRLKAAQVAQGQAVRRSM